MYKYIVFLMLPFMCSCNINGSFQGLFSYYNKTKKDTNIKYIHIDDHTEINKITDRDSLVIVIINGLQLSQYIKKYEKTVIYIWAPKCSSKYCYSLNLLQKECYSKNIELFVVAEYYDTKAMGVKYEIKNPIMGIDIKFYKTNLTSKYLSKFMLDLTSQSNLHDNFLYFEKGHFKKSFNTIEEF